MPLYTIDEPAEPLVRPLLVAALDGWVDAGSAATTALGQLAGDGAVIVTFDADAIYDYRVRRPTLLIQSGTLASLTWSELTIRHRRVGGRDVLVLSGAEPDYRWRELSATITGLLHHFGVTEWVSLGAIPAAVPHTRDVPILGTESRPGLLRDAVTAGPVGLLKVPAAFLSVLEKAAAESGIDALGYFAQIPHYVGSAYPAAAVALLRLVSRHLDEAVEAGSLTGDAEVLRARLDAVTSGDEDTRAHVERLELASDESRLPSGDDLIAEIERFLRDNSTN